MPRIRRSLDDREPPRFPSIVEQLADELRHNRANVQPLIDEQEFSTGLLRVNVVWDVWNGIPNEDRIDTILHAYEKCEGKQALNRIALATGWTVPEAIELGLLPYEVLPAIREGDRVTLKEAKAKMIELGASLLMGYDNPKLRFARSTDAEGFVRKLETTWPETKGIWVITKENGSAPISEVQAARAS
jgi:hypothetical protein